jgi:hypothetical protein
MDAKLTVPLPPELHAFVAREAEREDRSMASVVRRAVAEAAARRQRSAKAAVRDEMREAV